MSFKHDDGSFFRAQMLVGGHRQHCWVQVLHLQLESKLFCGLGGLTHGLNKSGINVLAGVDVDDHCRYPFEVNNSARFIKGDVSKLDAESLSDIYSSGSVKLLAGCAPCQPFSTYSRKGRKKNIDDRWELLEHFGRLISVVRPDLVTMENVPQLLEHDVFNRFLSFLDGYHVDYGVVNCTDLGIPQTRKRLVLLASRFGPIEFDAKQVRASKGKTVRGVISHLSKIGAGETCSKDRLHCSSRLSPLNLKRIRASKPGGTWRDWHDSLKADCHRRDTGATYPSVYGRMEWEKPSPTITTQCFGFGNGRFGHPEQDRAISLREASLIQTFPEDYRFLSDSEKVSFSRLGRLIGNSVPVVLGEAIGRSILNNVRQYS